jgi:ABC-2 type transport system permease protein
VVGFSTPVLYLALFTPLLRHLVGAPGLPAGHVLDLFLPGILALLAFASGSGPGFSTIFELRSGVIERFRVTPASRLAILAGPILASMLLMFAVDAVVVGIGAGLGFGLHAGGLLLLACCSRCSWRPWRPSLSRSPSAPGTSAVSPPSSTG